MLVHSHLENRKDGQEYCVWNFVSKFCTTISKFGKFSLEDLKELVSKESSGKYAISGSLSGRLHSGMQHV